MIDSTFINVWGDEFGLKEIYRGISQIFPKEELPLEAILNLIMKGEVREAVWLLFQGEWKLICQEILSLKELFTWLLVLGILATLLSRFVEIFNKNQVADLSFYLVYLCAVSVLFESYTQMLLVSQRTIENIQSFISLLIPTYLLTVGVATGTITATAGYETMTIILNIVQRVLLNIVLPMISVYMIFCVMNEIWIEEKLILILDFIKNVVCWILRLALGIVSGLSFFQAALTPVLDSTQTNVVKKAVGALPGIGDGLEGAAEIFVGSAIVIKNSVGILLLLLLIYLCVVPLAKLFLLSFVLKGTAALMGVVADKRLSSCTNHVGDAGMLLMKTTGTCLFLFFVSLAFISLSVKKY